jgi:hypothetical protein
MVRNLAWTGNPLYPYLQGFLGGPQTEMSVGVHMAQIGGTEAGSLDWILKTVGALGIRTLEPLAQGGFLGPHWLLLLPVAALIGSGTGDRGLRRSLWIFTIVGLLGWGSLVQMARFLLPVLVVGAALAGSAAVALVSSERWAIRWSFRALLVLVLLWNSTMIATTQNLDRLGVAAGLTDVDEEYMARWISYHPVIRYINDELPASSKILFVGEPRSFYFDRPIVVEDPFRTPLLVELTTSGMSAKEIAVHLGDLGITHVMVNAYEMPLGARLRGVEDFWSGASPQQQMVIDDFFDDWTVKEFGDTMLWVARLNRSREAATPPASP